MYPELKYFRMIIYIYKVNWDRFDPGDREPTKEVSHQLYNCKVTQQMASNSYWVLKKPRKVSVNLFYNTLFKYKLLGNSSKMA